MKRKHKKHQAKILVKFVNTISMAESAPNGLKMVKITGRKVTVLPPSEDRFSLVPPAHKRVEENFDRSTKKIKA